MPTSVVRPERIPPPPVSRPGPRPVPGRRPSPAVLLAGRLGRGALWIVAAFFLLQAIFTFLQLRQINVRSLQAMAELRENHELLAEWQQRAAFAQSPAFLEEAVKEFTLTRDTNEIVIVVEPSPVPPVGDIR